MSYGSIVTFIKFVSYSSWGLSQVRKGWKVLVGGFKFKP